MLTLQEVKKIAKMACLELSPAELEKYQTDLNTFLSHTEEIQKINTEGIKPLYQVNELKNITREDVIIQQNDELLTKLLEATPQDILENQFLVKDVL